MGPMTRAASARSTAPNGDPGACRRRQIDQIREVLNAIRDTELETHIVSSWNVGDLPQIGCLRATFSSSSTSCAAGFRATCTSAARRLPGCSLQHRVLRAPDHGWSRTSAISRPAISVHSFGAPPVSQSRRPGGKPARTRAAPIAHDPSSIKRSGPSSISATATSRSSITIPTPRSSSSRGMTSSGSLAASPTTTSSERKRPAVALPEDLARFKT